MRAYVINVSSATQRWDSCIREFQKIGLRPRRIEAVLGKTLTMQKRAIAATATCARYCPHAALGATMSHVKTWQIALREDEQGPALICEDDVVFAQDALQRLEAYMLEVPENWDVVYLGCLFCHSHTNVVADAALRVLGHRGESREISEHVWVPPYFFGAHCYLASSAGMRKLLAAFDQIDEAIDVRMNRLARAGAIHAYALRPLLALQRVNARETSMVGSRVPRLLNGALDALRIAPEVSVAYGLSYPFRRLGDHELSAWSILFLGAGFLQGALGFSGAASLGLGFAILSYDFWKRDAGAPIALATILVGWAIGASVRVRGKGLRLR